MEEFKSRVLGIFDELKNLYGKKNQQYGLKDALTNFRDGAFLSGDNPESLDACFRALKGYMNKHVSKVERSGELNQQVAESLGDIAVYSIIALAMWREKRDAEQQAADKDPDEYLSYLCARARKALGLEKVGIYLEPGVKPPLVTPDNAGIDFYCPRDVLIPAQSMGIKIPLGVHVALPSGHYMGIYMRSSYGVKRGLRLSNSVGVIDSSYRGEISAVFDNPTDHDEKIEKGERCCQGIIQKYKQPVFNFLSKASDLGKTARGSGGFGSTGK